MTPLAKNPAVFLAYAPRGPGLLCALACFSEGDDVYGWFVGPRQEGACASRYFLLEDFHANAPTRYHAVEDAELHAAWPLGEARRHRLAAMQAAFAREWLVFRDDARFAAELLAYDEAGYAAGEVNVRFARLAKLDTAGEAWTFRSQGFEPMVLRHLARSWPLLYRPHMERTAQALKHRHAGRARP